MIFFDYFCIAFCVKRMTNKILLYILTSLLLVSCKDISFLSFKDKSPLLASVGNEKLYFDDLGSVFHDGMSDEDSLSILKAHVDKWVKLKLKTQQSSTDMSSAQLEDIERQIEDYRNSLMTFNFDIMLALKVDTIVTKEEVLRYYQENRDKYRLIGPIVKAKIVTYPIGYRQERKLRELMNSNSDEAYYDIIDIVKKGEFKFDDFTSGWYYFKDVLQHIPFTQKKFDDFLVRNKVYEVTEGDSRYIMAVGSYRLTGDYIPVEMVETTIKAAIVNLRRKNYIKEVEDSLYTKSLADGLVVINVKDTISENIE